MTTAARLVAVPAPGAAAQATSGFGWRDFWRVSAIGHAVILVLRFNYVWLDDLVRAHAGTFLGRFIEESTGSLGSFLLSGLVFLVWQRAPLRDGAVARRIPAYLLLGLALSAANTTFMWASRTVAFPLVSLGPYDYGQMPLRYLMEAPSALIGLAMIVGALWLADEIVERRRQSTAQADLERALAESQLRSLRLQLQPHFLFNALNTIAAHLHENPRGADRLIGRLSELLRVSLRAPDAMLVPLRDEVALLGAYADLMRARFGNRLDLCIEVESSASEALIPPLLLQPLVENAIHHGGLERDGQARIVVTARRHDEWLTLRVHDDGPGLPLGRDPLASGTGLSTTARRVALLFGTDATLEARNADGGGFEVMVTLPVRRA
jgi:two-component system, LytTR family, sensor kinase